MSREKLKHLIEEVELNNKDEFFHHLIDLYGEGKAARCHSLFSRMKDDNQYQFLQFLRNNNHENIYVYYHTFL